MEQPNNKIKEMLINWKLEIEQELTQVKKQHVEIVDVLSKKEAQLAHVEALLEAQGWTDGKKRASILGQNSSVTDNAYAILEEHQKPLYYKDLLILMKERGVTVPGADPAANLLTHVSRDERFERTARGTYALQEWGIVKKPVKLPSKRKKKPTRRQLRK